MDFFENEEGVFIVLSSGQRMSLHDYVKNCPKVASNVKFVQSSLARMVKHVLSVHKSGVIHRSIDLHAFTLRESKGIYKVYKL